VSFPTEKMQKKNEKKKYFSGHTHHTHARSHTHTPTHWWREREKAKAKQKEKEREIKPHESEYTKKAIK